LNPKGFFSLWMSFSQFAFEQWKASTLPPEETTSYATDECNARRVWSP
jgi:hypothetical protein